MKPGLFACAVGAAAWLFLLGVGAVPCPDGQTLEVTSTADAQDLTDALNCTGGGGFDVIWYGSVEINSIFEVTDGISLTVTGSGSFSSLSPNGDTSTATIIGLDTTSETGIFRVSGASMLTLDNLVLRGGYPDSQEDDGAGVIQAQGSYGAIQTINVLDCHFMDNYGSSAGAIFARDSVVVNIYGDTSFTTNMGFRAGAIMVEDSAVVNMHGTTTFNGNTGEMAGAIYTMSDSQLNMYGASTFFNNTVDFGGAIYVSDANASIEGAVFSNNSAARHGGALRLLSGDISIGGNTTFTRNTADDYGGAIYADDANVRIEGAVFSKNSAGVMGGAIYAKDANVGIEGAVFSNNWAIQAGGALRLLSGDISIGGNTTFTRNTADDYGGAIYAYNAIVSIESAAFSNNLAALIGGALLLSGGATCIGGNTSFTSNTADTNGGAIYANIAAVSIDGAVFSNNSAAQEGGALFIFGGETSIGGNTAFTANTANDYGGAMYVNDANVSIEGAVFSNNLAALAGGALLLSGGATSIGGNTSFTSNTADTNGGAIYANTAAVSIDGAVFSNNLAGQEGGAIYAKTAAVSIDGAVFSNNLARQEGGALFLSGGETSIGGNSSFTSNTAYDNGGAVYMWVGDIRIGGDTTFTSNTADASGGAMYVNDANVNIEGAVFSNNLAPLAGGAMLAQESTISITGDTTFTNNTASGSGGGLDSTDCKNISITGNVSFSGNVAANNGGAISMDSAGYFLIAGATFERNEGASGGAIWTTATTGVYGLSIFRCTFEENSAKDGGALYIFNSGETEAYIEACGFRENNAVASGGAIAHTGTLNVGDTQFVANKAYIEGMAIASLGTVHVGSGVVVFERIALYCPPSGYAYDKDLTMEEDLDTCRAELVCTGCSTGCDSVHYGLWFASNSTVPAVDCKSLPAGTVASSAGTTVSTLDLAEGYYRTSYESHVVLECYRKESCHGGLDAQMYCVPGYTGPYCAVCADGYSAGSAYSCHECSGKKLRSAVALVVVTTIMLLGVVVIILSNLVAMVPVDGSNEEEQEGARGLRAFKLSCLHNFLVKVFPLTSIKIVVVVWQILTQFAAIAGAVYPDEYQRFLSILSPIDMDIGFILSFSCLADTNFYDRLLLSTTMPLVVLAVLAGTYDIAKKRNRRSETAVRAVQHKHLSAVLFVMFFVYSSVSFTVFQTLVCDTLDDGVGYLRADYSLTCWSDGHMRCAAYASVMALMYPIGIPAVLTWWLARNLQDLSKPGREAVARLQPFSGIWAAYRPSHFYYEVVECGRRIALTGIAAFVLPGSSAQIAVVLLLAVVFLFVSESMQPFQNILEMRLYRWGNGVVLGSMYVALLRKTDVSGDNTPAQSAFAGVLIAGNVFMVVAVLVQSTLFAKAWHARNEIVEIQDPFARHIRRSSVSCIQVVGDAEGAEMDALHVQMENTGTIC